MSISPLVKYAAKIFHHMTSEKIQSGSEIEVEVRFKNISHIIFTRVEEELSKIIAPEKINTTDFYVLDENSKFRRRSISSTQQPIVIIKKPIFNTEDIEYNFEVSVSLEEIKELSLKDRQKQSFARDKNRSRFHLYDGIIFADLTSIVRSDNDSIEVSYEIECEINFEKLISTSSTLEIEHRTIQTAIQSLNNTVNTLLKFIQDTEVIYSNSEKRQITKDYNTILQKNENNRIDSEKLNNYVLVTARNLKLKDCVYGGLIGGKINYSITAKADGFRKILMIHSSGIWLLTPPFTYNRIFPGTIQLKQYFGTILDGENIPFSRRRDQSITSKYYYLPFDTMAISGDISIQESGLFRRLQITEIITSLFPKNSIIFIGKKEFIPLGKTQEEFSQNLELLNSLLENEPFLTDGMMVTPIEAEYNPHSSNFPTNEQLLTLHPDTCKIKSWENLTIDLQFIRSNLSSETPGNLFMGKNMGKGSFKLIQFIGSKFEPFDVSSQVLWTDPFFRNVTDKSIIEFAPSKINEKIVLYPIRIRSDKTHPNRDEIAIDVWNQINNPLTIDTLLGKTFELVYQFHKKIKSELFASIPDNVDLIDIGVGRGADLKHQRRFHKILGIEPNLEFAEECQRRLESDKIWGNKYKLLKCGGEDSDQIISEAISHFGWKNDSVRRPLYITMMLSLSFFWKDPEMLESLARTLTSIKDVYGNNEVYFIFMTIEGVSTMKLIEERGESFRLGPITFDFTPPNIVNIDISTSIKIRNQTEYLVYLDELEHLANLSNLKVNKAVGEKLLSNDELTFTKLYIYGKAIIGTEK